MNLIATAFISAFIFGIGLSVSGMTHPEKVIGFLDVAGDWDPSLMFVMVGAILVHSISYRLITKRESPVLTTEFHIPSNRKIDFNLIVGSAIFGIGWGIGGFCPGPAVVSLVSASVPVVTFAASMVVGIYLHAAYSNLGKRKAS